MAFDDELIMLGATKGENEMGDPIVVPTRRSVLCDVQSVTRSEHYQAAAHGLKPEMVFVVNKYEYQGEKEVEFEGETYRVIRTYTPKKSKGLSDFETVELVCEGA